MEAEVAAREAEVRLEQLPEVHARRHAERVQDDVHRTSVRQERHVAARQNARDDALVSVASGHLVADRQVLLVHEEHAHLLDDLAVAELPEEPAVAVRRVLDGRELDLERVHDRRDLVARRAFVHAPVRMRLGERRELALLYLLVRRGDHVAGLGIYDVNRKLLVHQLRGKLADEVLLELRNLVLALLLCVLLGALGLLLVHRLGLLGAVHLHAHDDASRSGRDGERRVADVSGLLSEDRPEQPLLGRKLGLALRRDLADEDVAGAHLRADADNAVLAEVLERVLGDVRDVAGYFLRPELRVAGRALKGDDVERRERVLADKALVDEDSVLEVVAAPAHERDKQVLSERQLALIRRRTVGQAVALLDLVALLDDRLLVEARSGVATAELLEVVAPDSGVRVVRDARGVLGGKLSVLCDDDVVRRDVRNGSGRERGHDDAAVLGADAFKACSRPSARGWRRRARGTG